MATERSIVGTYRHFKQPEPGYFVYGEGHDNNGDRYVVYVHKGPDTFGREDAFWIRPYDMFFDNVSRPELQYEGPRFAYVNSDLPERADVTRARYEGHEIGVYGLARHSESPEAEYLIVELGQKALFALVPIVPNSVSGE